MKQRAALFLFLCLMILTFFSGCAETEGTRASSAPSLSPSAEPGITVPEPTAAAEPEVTPEPALPGRHTLRLSTENPPRSWNVHNWVNETDAFLWSLTVSPLVDLGLEPGEDGEGEDAWLFTMAESVEDITDSWEGAADWGIGPEERGRVWRIRLNPAARWNDEAGTPINADSYVDSMRLCLAPERDNYRADYFSTGPMALAGAAEYHRSGADSWVENAGGTGIAYPYGQWIAGDDGIYCTPEGNPLYFSLSEPLEVWLGGNSLEDYYNAGFVPEEIFTSLRALANEGGYAPVTEESLELLYAFTGSDAWGREPREDLAYYTVYKKSWPVTSWDSVGLLKEDEHTLLYITRESIGEFDFLFGLTTPWLVYTPLYESGSFAWDGRIYTDYGTSPETSVSCGPYRLTGLDEKRAVLERCDDWFGFEGRDSGLYETDRILLSFLSPAEAAQRFAEGELDVLVGGNAPSAEAALLYKDDAYIYRFFMVTDREALYRLQEQADGDRRVNKTCLANDAFREALSYAIDRSRLAEAGEEFCRPALGLIGDLYRYDVAHDLRTRYRASTPGMASLCSAYGVSLAAVTDADGLRTASKSCTGYDPARARRLFQTACDQMTAAGEWSEDMVIELTCAVSSGEELSEKQTRQNELLQSLLEEATAGTGFAGKCFIRFVCLPDRYAAVAAGEVEMGYGAWGGAAFDPFGLMQCYCDPDFNTIQEGCGFDPRKKLLTLLIQGEIVTRTYSEWCRSLLEDGEYASDTDLRLKLLANLEEALLKERRFIVIAQGASPVWISEKLTPGSEAYSILTGFGGIRSLRYTLDDAQWADRP